MEKLEVDRTYFLKKKFYEVCQLHSVAYMTGTVAKVTSQSDQSHDGITDTWWVCACRVVELSPTGESTDSHSLGCDFLGDVSPFCNAEKLQNVKSSQLAFPLIILVGDSHHDTWQLDWSADEP